MFRIKRWKKLISLILRMLPSSRTDFPAEDQNIGAWKHGKNNAQSWVQLCSHVIWRKSNWRTSGQTVFLMDEVIFRKWECNWLYILTVISKANSLSITFRSVQSLSRVRLFVTPWITAGQASLSITNCWSLPKLKSIESVMPSSHLILCRPLLLMPAIPPSIRVFSTTVAFLKKTPTCSNWNYKGQSLDYVWGSCI